MVPSQALNATQVNVGSASNLRVALIVHIGYY